MFEERSLKLDLVALALLALTIFLAAALLSYRPSDPPSDLVWPPQNETLNVCGRSGAVASVVLFKALGLAAYYLLISLAVLTSLLLTRQRIGQPMLRGVGWLLSLVGFATLAAMAGPSLSPGPVIGAGGYLGAAGKGLLETNFATVGAFIFSVSLLLGGLLLSTDYLLIRVFAWCVGRPVRGVGRGAIRVGMAYAGKLRGAADSEEADAAEDEASGPAVRIIGHDEPSRRKRQKPAAEVEPVKERSDAGKAKSGIRVQKPKKTEREEVLEEIEAADVPDQAREYELPSVELLTESQPFSFEEHEKDVRRKAGILEKTFANFGLNVRVVEIQTGPVVAQFEVELEAGLRLSKITALADDLAIALRVPSVRVVAPIPGKNTVGIEVPNLERQLVRMREVIEESNGRVQKMRIPIFLGKDVAGDPLVFDLASLPHLLIAGRTGTGKSVCLNSMIISMLMTRRPDEVRMLLIDPKMVELNDYKQIPHLMHPVVTDMRKAEAILGWAVEKMEERYQLLARAGVRHISVYNQLGEEELMERMRPECDEDRRNIPTHLPYIVIVADEMADLMMTAAKEVETHIIRLAQKSRAVGIHLVLATQKPTVDVITGLIKSNLPARISFQVASRIDSRVVLDEMGADKLLGSGDMLFLWPGTSALIRGQGTYVSDDEIAAVIKAVATAEPQYIKELVQLKPSEPEGQKMALNNRDELYEAAVDLVVREGRGSVSLLQRALGIGYGRAARLIDYMAEDGIVGPYNGSQARDILISLGDWEVMSGQAPSGQQSAAPARSRRVSMEQSRFVEEEEEKQEEQEDEEPSGDDPEEDLEETTDEEAPWEEEDEEEEEQEEDAAPDDSERDEPDQGGMRPGKWTAESA